MSLESGTKLGRYEIRSKIGAGGMGDVYLALDTKLDRRVALKILPADVASQRDRMDRFVREAKAAAALNHPNIAHVYEIDESSGTHFIAIEFVDGFTFRELIHGKQTDLAKLLRYLQQAAEGLAKAHAAGIVHRDFKPDNVMVTREGHAKILDFGLAKLVEPESFSGHRRDEGFSETATALMQQHSTPGAVLGTVGYMSPEQAQGKVSEIDHRSDIFSFGCILYEAVTRRKAFEGKDAIDSLNKIIREQPASLNSLNPDSPHELQRIVRRCLAKDPDDRYQTIKDVAIELRDLRRELEESGHTTAPPATDSFGEPASGGSITSGQTTPREGGTPSTRVSSAEYIISGIKQHKMWAAATAAAILIVVIGGAFGIYKLRGRKQPAISFQGAKFTRLTSSGKVIDAAISPDGKWLVHVVDDGGQQSLGLRQVAIASSNTQIVPPAAVHFTGEVFSPDGNYVYYSIQEERGALYRVPVLGGTARKLRSDVDSAVAFSPDGKQIAYFHYSLEEDADKLMIANADGSNERQLARRGGNESLFAGATTKGVSWSPDGKTIASSAGGVAGDRFLSVVTVSVDKGELKFFSAQKWFDVSRVEWLTDESILVAARELRGGPSRIWQVSYPGGEAQPLTTDLDSYINISLSADRKLLAAVERNNVANLWVMSGFDAAKANQITQGQSFNTQPSWTPGGQIVFPSRAGDNIDLYSVDARGGSPKQLTVNAATNTAPCVSFDGRYVVFVSNRSGRTRIWRMDADGSNAKPLTEGIAFAPSCAPADSWFAFQGGTPPLIWRMSMDGGQPTKIDQTDFQYAPLISPDGKRIACFYNSSQGLTRNLVSIIPAEGGPRLKTLELGSLESRVRWSPDGQALVYALTRSGVSNLWAQPVAGGPPKQLTNFTSERIFAFDFSHDGKQLALSRGTRLSDVVLISNFQQ